MLHSKVTQKGQVTIPAKVREELNINEGDTVHFTQIDKDTMSISVRKNLSLRSLAGFLQKPDKSITLDEMQEIIEESSNNDRD